MIKNFLILIALSVTLVSCSGAQTIAEPTATIEKPLPTPVTKQVTPTPAPVYDVGANSDQLKGTTINVWYALSGERASLFEKFIATYNITNDLGVELIPVHFNTVFQLNNALVADDVESPALILSAQPVGSDLDSVDLFPYAHIEDGKYALPETIEEYSSSDVAIITSLPFTRSARYLLYDQSFAMELGFEQAPDNFEAFTEQICAANAYWKTDDDQTNDGYGGYLLDGDTNWQEPFGWIARDLGLDGEENALDPSVSLLDIEKARDDGCIWYQNGENKFQSLKDRRALVISIDLQDGADIEGARKMLGISDDLKLIPFPQQHGLITYGLDLSIPPTEPKQQLAAYIFAHWLLDEPRQVEWALETNAIPVTRESLVSLRDHPQAGADLKQALVYAEYFTPLSALGELSLDRVLIGDGFYQWVTRYPYTSMDDILSVFPWK